MSGLSLCSKLGSPFIRGSPFASVAGVGVEDDGHGAVIDQGDLHHGTEFAAGDAAAAERGFELHEKTAVERLRHVGRSGVIEGGAGALAGAGVQGELADDEGVAMEVE